MEAVFVRHRSSLNRPLIASFVVHGVFVMAWLLITYQAHKVIPQKTVTEIQIVTPKPKDLHLKKPVNKQTLVVQTELTKESQTPTEDAYLGQQNQKVDRQTMSTNKASSAALPQNPVSKALPEKRTDSLALSNLGVINIKKELNKSQEQKENQKIWDLEKGYQPGQYIKGVTESDRTALNTREFVFFAYFKRIRDRLDLAWENLLKENLTKLVRSGRTIASEQDHTTRTLVTLNATGEIVKVQVLQESGVLDLDDAAVRAFNKAGPFPNPPKGIIESDGTIQIKWEFVLKT